jgi:hypothetical protein
MSDQSIAAKEAERWNLSHAGWGKWADASGKVVAHSTPTGLKFVKNTGSTKSSSIFQRIAKKFSKKQSSPQFIQSDEQKLRDAFEFLKQSSEFNNAVIQYGKTPTNDNRHRISLAAMSALTGTEHEPYLDTVVDALSGYKKDKHTVIKGRQVTIDYVRKLVRNLRGSLKIKNAKLNRTYVYNDNQLTLEFHAKRANLVQAKIEKLRSKGKSEEANALIDKAKAVHIFFPIQKHKNRWVLPREVRIQTTSFSGKSKNEVIPLPFEWTNNFMNDYENITQLLTPILNDKVP